MLSEVYRHVCVCDWNQIRYFWRFWKHQTEPSHYTLASISDHSSVSSSLATCLSEIILVISLMGQRLWNLITDIFLVMCWTRSRLMGISSSWSILKRMLMPSFTRVEPLPHSLCKSSWIRASCTRSLCWISYMILCCKVKFYWPNVVLKPSLS